MSIRGIIKIVKELLLDQIEISKKKKKNNQAFNKYEQEVFQKKKLNHPRHDNDQ